MSFVLFLRLKLFKNFVLNFSIQRIIFFVTFMKKVHSIIPSKYLKKKQEYLSKNYQNCCIQI